MRCSPYFFYAASLVLCLDSASLIVSINGTTRCLVAAKVLNVASETVLSPIMTFAQFYTVRFHISILNGVQEIPLPPSESKTLKSKVEALNMLSNNITAVFLNPYIIE